MYYYQPPKSSIWGHALRKMPAAKARDLLQQFLETAAARFEFFDGSLSLRSSPRIREFEEMLGVPSQHSAFFTLNEQQCNVCIDALVKDEKLGGDLARSCILVQPVTIFRWRLSEQAVETPSQLMMYYGQMPCISTTLQFTAVEDFHRIQKMMAEIGLCKLNEKHLKILKVRKGKP